MGDIDTQSSHSSGNTNLANIERALEDILQAIGNGHGEGIDKTMNQVGKLVKSLNAAEAHADPQAVSRVQELFKKTALSMATATRKNRDELRHLSAGKRSLRAYRP